MSKYSAKKTTIPSQDDLQEFANIFNALSHPHRLKIFLGLVARCSSRKPISELEARACVSEAGKGLGIAPSTLSHHIKELRQVGLVRMEKNGQTTDCWVEAQTIKRLKNFFSGLDGGCCP